MPRNKGSSMNWDRIEGNWKQVAGKVKEKWGKLTDDDIAEISGNREQLEGKIQARYGYAKDQVKKEVDDWARPHVVLTNCGYSGYSNSGDAR
jgi:uncharacterized protein YjbJ (UPF0337 family)